MAHVRDAFRNKCTLPDACLRETASSSFGVRPRYGCEIDTERFRQSAMRRQLLPSAQATARDVFGQRLDDAPVNRRSLSVGIQSIHYSPIGHFVCNRQR